MLSERLVRFSLGCCRLSCLCFRKSALSALSSQEINAFSLWSKKCSSTRASNSTQEKGVLMTHMPQKVILLRTAMLAALDFDSATFKLRQQGIHILIYFRLIRRVWIKALLLIGVCFIGVHPLQLDSVLRGMIDMTEWVSFPSAKFILKYHITASCVGVCIG